MEIKLIKKKICSATTQYSIIYICYKCIVTTFRHHRFINIWAARPPYPTIGCQVPRLLERDSQYMYNVMGLDYT